MVCAASRECLRSRAFAWFVCALHLVLPLRSAALYPEPEFMDSTWMGDGEGMPAPTAEKAALVDLWRSTAGSHWGQKWDLRTDPCNDGWYGVFCDEKGHIISIDLSQNHLLGYLPSSMGRLKFLQKLILNHNLLTGIIPKSFFQLENLEEVNLSHNRLTGSLPKGWGKLEYIRVLHLAHNEWEEKKLPPELYKLQEQGTDVWFNEDTTDPSNADKLLGVDAYSNLYKY
eukprot:Stramenopile-MAST_4_protein_1962